MSIGGEHVPGAVLQLVGELAGLPGDEAGEKARTARLVADDVVDRLLLDRGLESWHHRQRFAARAGGALDKREDQLGAHRAAEVHRLAHFLLRCVLWEDLAERQFGWAVDDEADV